MLCFSSFAAVPQALLLRDGKYRAVAAFELTRILAAALVTLTLALRHAGYWALVVGQIAGAALPAIGMLVFTGVPFTTPSKANALKVFRYCREVTVGRLGWVAYQSAHISIAGRLLGTTITGVYSFAWNLASLPNDKLGAVFTSVMPATLSRHATKQGMWSETQSIVAKLGIIIMPALTFVVIATPLLIETFFGTRWLVASTPLRILTLYALIQWPIPILNQLLIVADDIAFQRRLGAISVCSMVPAFWLGARYFGLLGLCLSWLIAWPITGVAILRQLARLQPHSVKSLLGSLRTPCIVSVAVAIATSFALQISIQSNTLRLVAVVSVVLCCYAPLVALLTDIAIGPFARLRRLLPTLRSR
jgi:O-antigen/teichoic acid export membrane protein